METLRETATARVLCGPRAEQALRLSPAQDAAAAAATVQMEPAEVKLRLRKLGQARP